MIIGIQFLLVMIDLHMIPIFLKFQEKIKGSSANLINKISSAMFCATAKFVCCSNVESVAVRAMCITTIEGSVQMRRTTVRHKFIPIN